MSGMKIYNSIFFPFKCSNPECEKEYDSDQFAEIVLLWGYIYLLSEENEAALIGLTCPECKKTSILKYRAYIAMEFLWSVQKHIKDKHQVNSNVKMKEWWEGKYFSADHLSELGYIEAHHQKAESKDCVIYTIPTEINLKGYSKRLQDSNPFTLIEDDILKVLEIENGQSYKAIPRVLPAHAPNPWELDHTLDAMLLDRSHENINKCMRTLLKPNPEFRVNPYEGLTIAEMVKLREKNNESYDEFAGSFVLHGLSWKQKELSKKEEEILLSQNDLRIEEYAEFKTSHLSWKRKEFQENVDPFFKTLEMIPNRIDCELVFKNQLINEYGRKFYYQTGTSEEYRSNFNEFSEMEESGFERVTGYDELDFEMPVPSRWINGPRLMKRWDMEARDIINLIQTKGLLGYDNLKSCHVSSSDHTQFPPQWISDLTLTDSETQKRMMQQYWFDPDAVKDFEQKYPKMLAESKSQNHDSTQETENDKINEMDFKLNASDLKQEVKKLRPSEKAKRCCRIRTQQLWEKYPDMKIAQVVRHEALKKCFIETGADKNTLRARHEWIKDLAPSNSPGAPTKKQQ